MRYSDYNDFLYSYNLTGNPSDTSVVPGVALNLSVDGDYIVDYSFIKNVTDFDDISYYAPYTSLRAELAISTYLLPIEPI